MPNNARGQTVENPVFASSSQTTFALAGRTAKYLQAVTEQWIMPACLANPAMLEMFRRRDNYPLLSMEPWAGEFAGKYLTHAVQIYRLTGDECLYDHIAWFVNELVSLQAEDGYLGPWPKGSRLTGKAPNPRRDGVAGTGTWDAWGHYHIMLGLLFWHEVSGDVKAMRCVKRMADLFCAKFLTGGKRLVDAGRAEMNLAPIHSLCLLYKKTKTARYLALARKISEEFADPAAGDYIRTALAGKEFYQSPKPRWESLHPIQGIAELYYLTGDEQYRRAFEHIWWSIVKLDRHNTGGFSSGEAAQGNPYHQGAIETCCTVAWMALSVDMLRLTGNSIVADELELSMLNSGLGMMNPSGRYVTYNTPMDGTRTASPTDCTAFQARPGQPELNCCSVNGPRALGLLCEWALMTDETGLVLNYYGPGSMSTVWAGLPVSVEQTTSYPENGKIVIRMMPRRQKSFSLKLRIPYWSARTRVKVNGKAISNVCSGQYLSIERLWRRGDTVELALDMSLHFWRGHKQCRNKTSVFRGPILLAYDPRFNEGLVERIPELDAGKMAGRRVRAKAWPEPWLLWQYPTAGGKTIRLCDYASAGLAGDRYRSWLPIRNAPAGRFSCDNPLRSSRC